MRRGRWFWWLAAGAFGLDIFTSPRSSIPEVVFVLSLAAGIPHGALDHRFAPSLRLNAIAFHLVYVVGALLVLTLWWVSPSLAFYGFLFVAGWHFGESDLLHLPPFLRTHGVVATRGALLVATPVLLDPQLVLELVDLPGLRELAALPGPVRRALVVVPLVVHLLALLRAGRRHPGWIRILQLEVVDAGILAGLLWTAGPLLGFSAYFIGWHTAAHFERLAKQGIVSGGVMAMVRAAAPRTIGALAIVGLLWLAEQAVGGSWDWSRGLLLATSALTLPHALVVHWSSSLSRGALRSPSPHRQSRRGPHTPSPGPVGPLVGNRTEPSGRA